MFPAQRVSGWCEDIRNRRKCRPGAAFLNFSRKGRVCPLQRKSAREGIQVVPRNHFRPESLDSGRFHFLRRENYVQRAAEGVRAPAGGKQNL